MALNQMFKDSLRTRPNAPKTLIYLTDGKCNSEGCSQDMYVPYGCRSLTCKCKCEAGGIDCRIYGLCQKHTFEEWGKRFERNQIRTIGIGVSDMVNEDEIISVVGESNFYKKQKFNELLTKEFRKSLAICDRK